MFYKRRFGLLLLIAFLLTDTAVNPNLAWGKIDNVEASSISPNLGPYLNIWTDAKDNGNATVVYNSDYDEYLVVWTTVQDAYTYDIWGRRIASDGTLLSWFCIVNLAGEKLSAGAAAYSTVQDRYIVVFDRPYVNDPNDHDLWAITFDYDGTDFSSIFMVDYSTNNQLGPSVAYNSIDDEFLVVYSNQKPGVCLEAVAQRVDAETSLAVGERVTTGTCAAGYTRSSEDVVYNPIHNNYLIAFRYNRTSPYRSYVYVQVASNDVSTLGPEFQVSGDNANLNASIALGQDEYLVAFITDMNEVYARRVNYDGTLPVPGNGFLIATSPNAYYPIMVEVAASKHGYWLEWVNEPVLSDTNDIFGNFVPMGTDQTFSGGFPIDVEVNSQTAGHIACRWQGGCLVADSYNLEWPAGDFEIRARILYPFGIYLPLVVH